VPFDDVEVRVAESGGLNCYEDLLGPGSGTGRSLSSRPLAGSANWYAFIAM